MSASWENYEKIKIASLLENAEIPESRRAGF